MALDPRKEAAWKNAFTKGSKKIQANLRKIHAKNPEFQEFIDKHGFGVTLSKKKAENLSKKKPTSSPTVKPTSPAHPEAKKGPVDRLAMIKAAQQKRNRRAQAAANRQAWGGELGGGFQMPGNAFRTYKESLDEMRKKKVLGFDMQLRPPQVPAPKGGHKVPKGYERIKDVHGTNVLRKKVAERFEELKPELSEGFDDHKVIARELVKRHGKNVSKDDIAAIADERDSHKPLDQDAVMRHVKRITEAKWGLGKRGAEEPISWDSAIVRTRFGGIKSPKHKKDKFINKVRRVARKKIKKVLATEYTEMSSKEALQELKKSTYASYLQKAPKRVRSGTSLAKGFEDDYYAHMKVANKHSPNVIHYDGTEKDPDKLKVAEKGMKVAKELQGTFKRSANNRIKGIQRAGRLLSREEAEEFVNESNSLARPELWDTHELRGEDGKAIKKGQVVKDFRGEPHKVMGFAPPHKPSSSGRVYTKHGDDFEHEGSFFPGVINASIHKKSAVKEGFVGLYKAKRQAMFEAKTEGTVASEVEEEQVVEEERKPDYRDVRRALVRKGK